MLATSVDVLMFLANSVERKLGSFSAIQEIFRIWFNLKVHYRIHMSPPPVRIMTRWMKPTPFRSIYLTLISIFLSFLGLGLPSGLFLFPNLVTILLFMMCSPGIFAAEQKLTHVLRPQKSWGICFETHCLFCWSDISLGFVYDLNFDVILQVRKWNKPEEWRPVQ